MRHLAKHLLLISLLSVAVPATAGAHGGATPAAESGTPLRVRDCFFTAAYVPRPESVLDTVFSEPLDLDTTFYGPDPLLGVWGLSCDGARLAGDRLGKVTISLVGVPFGLTSANALPVANNFAHRLIRIDTNSRDLAAAARRAGLPAKFAERARYEHSRRSASPSEGRLSVPGRYAMDVSASEPDPTNPHDHANVFEHRRPGGTATLTLSIADALDRFCLQPELACSASVRAPRGSALRRLLGARSADARAGFDHQKVPRIDIRLRGES